MKTRMLLVVVALLGLFLGHEAQAYYNSTTGRWLSRDPVREPGFNALFEASRNSMVENSKEYRFVDNNALGKADLLGLEEFWGYGNWCGWSRYSRT